MTNKKYINTKEVVELTGCVIKGPILESLES